MMENKEYDIILFGVTGFTGQLCAEYMFERAAANAHDVNKDTDCTSTGTGTDDDDDDGNNKKNKKAIKWATSARDPSKAETILKDLLANKQCNPRQRTTSTTTTTTADDEEEIPLVFKADLVCDTPEQVEILRNIVKKTKGK